MKEEHRGHAKPGGERRREAMRRHDHEREIREQLERERLEQLGDRRPPRTDTPTR